ncbi:uncharacterized protein LOC584396 [Strongylocentrotus purpuratus]|uniref:Partner and localiser of BRCA2 WD40 domain-containing protein n=1 Tax=Strongylocentrotus purpuratus TaxID=7668 RepID=A0A7M7NQ15_STRPU|nr:uncharacterized protein LOC584396 [Strongylocentrotus purpuratus]
MASPSAGLTKEEIKERLAHMKKQYAQMQKKLEKSDKATRVKRHVSKKIADYKRKQATDGSPECTISKAADSPKDTPENTGSPSLPLVNRGRLSSKPKVSASREKSGKRRSVSFAPSSQSTPTSSRHDAGQGTAFAHAQSGEVLVGVNQKPVSSVSPLRQVQKTDSSLRKSGDRPNKKLFRRAKSKKQKWVTASSSRATIVDQSKDGNAGFVSSDRLDSEQDVSVVKDEDTSTDEAKSKSDPLDNTKHEVDSRQVQEILSSPDAKTPPLDTQFDLFADTDVQDESPHVKMGTVDASLQAASPCALKFKSPGHAEKEPLQDSVSGYGLKRHNKALEESVIILDETQGDIFYSQTSKRCTQDVTQRDTFHTQTSIRCTQDDEMRMPMAAEVQETPSAMRVSHLNSTSNTYSEAVKRNPSVMMSKPDNSTRNYLHVEVDKEMAISDSHQDMIHSVSDEEGTEDPDVIPSTFPEDLEPVTKAKSIVSSQNSNSDHLNAMRAKCNQDRDPSPLTDAQNTDYQSASKRIMDEMVDIDESEMKVSSQKTNTEEVDMAQTSTRMSGNCGVNDKDTKNILRHSDTQQNINHFDDPSSVELDSQDVLIHSQEITSQRSPLSPEGKGKTSNPSSVQLDSQDILIHSQEITSHRSPLPPEGKGKTGTQRRRRRKNQRSIDNLSVDDISLKDFVVSQQNSQEGSHSWIDGLMYPAEYYVRKTRSMSRPSPNQHSAPPTGQKRSSKSSQGRAGSLPRTFQNAAVSEPVVHTKLLDAQQVQAEKDESEVGLSEKIDLVKDDTCTFVEKSQDYVRKESSPPRKMKVLRKPATTKRRLGRKSSRKKLENDSECSVTKTAETSQTLAQTGSSNEQDNASNRSQKSQDIYICSYDRDRNEIQNICDDKDGTTLFSSNHALLTGKETGITTSPCHLQVGLDSQGNPVENTVSHAEGPVCEGNKYISITQMTNNPLESQFTQTQVPSNFALPRVFGSPGQSTQCLVGLSPGSPASTAIDALDSPTVRQSTSQHGDGIDHVSSPEHRRHNDENQECSEHQWMSEVYLADVVPELPPDVNSKHKNVDNLQEVGAGHLSLEEHDMRLSQDLDMNGHPNILPKSQSELIASVAIAVPVVSATQLIGSSVQGTSNIPKAENHVSESLSYPLPVPCDDIQEDEQRTSQRASAPDLYDIKEPILDHIPSRVPGVPSSLCSNVNQGSPMADAATGTPPEAAEMPQAQSQCTDSYGDGSEFDRNSWKEIAGSDLSVKECFQFKGCLKHKTEHSTEVKHIISSRLVTEDVSEPLIAVVFPKEIVFWVLRTAETGKVFQVLFSWRTSKSPERVTFFTLLPDVTDAVEALVVVGDEDRSHSVRCIRWDCKKAKWKDTTVLSSAVMPHMTCTSLCALQDRKAAIALHKKAIGSEVLIVGLSANGSERQDFPSVTLPASKDRINSLTVVEDAVHMLLGVTDSEALLWHVPSHQLVQEFCLKDQKMNYSIEATAESGLLFMVACRKHDDNHKDHTEEPACSLLVLNPLNGRSSKLLNYSAPCMQPGVQIHDVSVCTGKTLAASLTSGHTCLWDLHSSQLLMEARGHEPGETSTALCLQDAETLLLGADGCVNVYERNF